MSKRKMELLSRKEVHEQYGFSISYLEKHPEVPSLQIGRRVYYPREELEHWISQFRRQSVSDLRELVDEILIRIEGEKHDKD